MTTHQPDKSRLPQALQSLDWRPMDLTRTWREGTTLLVAVPLLVGRLGAHANSQPESDWRYNLSIVTLECERRILVRCNGFEFDWPMWDCDWYVVISE